MFKPDHRWLALWVLHPNQVELALNFASEALAKAFHVFGSIQIDQFYLRCKWTKCHSLVEFSLYQLNLDQLDNAFTVHVSKLVVAIDAEVGTHRDVAHFDEVQAFESHWDHALLVTINKLELVKALPLLINLDPGIERNVRQNLVLSLQSKLLAKLAAGSRTHDIVVPLLATRRFERPLHIVEDAIAVQAHALEVPSLVVGDRHDLLGGAQLLDHIVGAAIKDLNVALVKRHHDELIVA